MKKYLIIAVSIIALAAGCATTAEIPTEDIPALWKGYAEPDIDAIPPMPEEKSLLVIIRKGDEAENTSIPIEVNRRWIGSTKGQSAVFTLADPGWVRVTSDSADKARLRFYAQKDRVYYINQNVEVINGTLISDVDLVPESLALVWLKDEDVRFITEELPIQSENPPIIVAPTPERQPIPDEEDEEDEAGKTDQEDEEFMEPGEEMSDEIANEAKDEIFDQEDDADEDSKDEPGDKPGY